MNLQVLTGILQITKNFYVLGTRDMHITKNNTKGSGVYLPNNTMKALITRKLGMTSTINDDGTMQAVTLLSASPCVITQIKDTDTDGYKAIQVGFEESKRVNKAQTNHFKKSKVTPKVVREFRTEDVELSEDNF